MRTTTIVIAIVLGVLILSANTSNIRKAQNELSAKKTQQNQKYKDTIDKAYKKADKNGNGVVNVNEFVQAYRAASKALELPEPAYVEVVETFNLLEVHKSGVVERDDFEDYFNKLIEMKIKQENKNKSHVFAQLKDEPEKEEKKDEKKEEKTEEKTDADKKEDAGEEEQEADGEAKGEKDSKKKGWWEFWHWFDLMQKSKSMTYNGEDGEAKKEQKADDDEMWGWLPWKWKVWDSKKFVQMQVGDGENALEGEGEGEDACGEDGCAKGLIVPDEPPVVFEPETLRTAISDLQKSFIDVKNSLNLTAELEPIYDEFIDQFINFGNQIRDDMTQEELTQVFIDFLNFVSDNIAKLIEAGINFPDDAPQVPEAPKTVEAQQFIKIVKNEIKKRVMMKMNKKTK